MAQNRVGFQVNGFQPSGFQIFGPGKPDLVPVLSPPIYQADPPRRRKRVLTKPPRPKVPEELPGKRIAVPPPGFFAPAAAEPQFRPPPPQDHGAEIARMTHLQSQIRDAQDLQDVMECLAAIGHPAEDIALRWVQENSGG